MSFQSLHIASLPLRYGLLIFPTSSHHMTHTPACTSGPRSWSAPQSKSFPLSLCVELHSYGYFWGAWKWGSLPLANVLSICHVSARTAGNTFCITVYLKNCSSGNPLCLCLAQTFLFELLTSLLCDLTELTWTLANVNMYHSCLTLSAVGFLVSTLCSK